MVQNRRSGGGGLSPDKILKGIWNICGHLPEGGT